MRSSDTVRRSVGDALAQLLGREVRQQRAQHLGGDLLVRLARQGGHVHLGLAQRVRNEQAAVIGDALTNRLLGGQRIGGATVEWKVVVTMNPSA